MSERPPEHLPDTAFLQALRTSEERFRALVLATSEAVLIFAPGGEMSEDSPSWREFTGQSAEECKGWRWAQAVHPEDRARCRALWSEDCVGAGCRRAEFRVRRADGQYRWVALHVVPLAGEDGTAREWVGSLVDVTARRQVEIQRHLFVSLAEHSTEFTGMADHDLIPFFVNPKGLELVGLDSLEQALQTPVEEFFYPEDRPFIVNEFLPRALKEGAGEVEIRFRHFKSGEPIWMVYKVFVIYDEYGNPSGHATVSHNVTERRRAEEELRETARQLQFTLDAAQIGDWHLDLESGESRTSARHDRCFGRTEPPGSWGVEQFLRQVHPEDAPAVEAHFRAALVDRGDWHFECRVVWPDRSVHWIASHGLVHHEQGRPTRMSGIVHDVTESRKAEEELRSMNRRKDEFLAMLAHELRNPLAPIKASADLMRLARLDETQVRRTSEIISRQVGHMTSLVDDLLDVSRVTRGLVKLESKPVDMKRVIVDAVEQARPLIEGRRHHLTVHAPPEATLVRGDPKRLVQVVVNLLTNAAKYTAEGGRIFLDLAVDGRQVELEVIDNGIGMTPEMAQRAFELFAQAERTPDRSQGGLGIGLALVRSLVELHGGRITAHSAGLGKGSRFTVLLPLQEGQDRGTGGRREEVLPVAGGRPLKVLIVDDNVDAAQTLALLAQTLGHRTFVEHGSRQGLERARLERPHVCLLDIGLPDMNGYELARSLRAQSETATALLVAVSGYGQEKDRDSALGSGFDRYFVKPLDAATLARLLSEAGADREGA